MESSKSRLSRRKPSGPQRSATPLDNFLKPGVLFRFPSDFDDLKMPATFVSANFPDKMDQKAFENIAFTYFESFNTAKTLTEPISFEDTESLSSNSTRSMSPMSVPLGETSSKSFTPPTPSIQGNTTGKRRRCESCGTRKTPYWRDGWEPGVLLCNACGIRFHKYRKLCGTCRCIAKKDERGHLHCPKCFDKL